MILSVGEILIDQIETTISGKMLSERHAGGAPFNVIYNANKTGSKCVFVGSVGLDDNGKFLIDFANKCNLYKSCIQQISKKTTIALVTNDESGERHFRFIRNDTADYQIDYNLIDKKLLGESSIIHLGSLMLSEESGRKTADLIITYAKENQKLISFDVNFRSDIFKNEKEAKKIYQKYIDSADILKLSDDELELFAGTKNIEEAVNKLYRKDLMLLITFGSKGSFYKYNDLEIHCPTEVLKPVDTTGAGDAFYGTFLGLFDKTLNPNSKEDIMKILKESNHQGALTTQFKGAIR